MLIKTLLSVAVLLILPAMLAHSALVADEAATKEDCHRLHEAIDQYTADRKTLPNSAQDLVDARYVRDIASAEQCRIAWQSIAS